MTFRIGLPLLTLCCAATLAAQENPLSSEAQQAWNRTKNNLLGAAEKMPEDAYSFKPAAESQSFKDLVAHTADSAAGTCSAGPRFRVGRSAPAGPCP